MNNPNLPQHQSPTIDQEYIQLVRQGLRDTVLYGSARSLRSLPVSSAGKTGTAQFQIGKEPHGWFTGFAPFVQPEILVTVLTEESGGSDNATPLARDILRSYFQTKRGAAPAEGR